MKDAQESKRMLASQKVQKVKNFHWHLITAVLASFMSLGMAYFFSTQNAPAFLTTIFLLAPLLFAIVGIIYYSTISTAIRYLEINGKKDKFSNTWKKREQKPKNTGK